jgi:hypothetical protein
MRSQSVAASPGDKAQFPDEAINPRKSLPKSARFIAKPTCGYFRAADLFL